MASDITVYYATNRNGPVQESGETTFTNGFQSENPDYYRVGWATVRADKGKYDLKGIEVAPETHAESGDDADAELGSTKLFREIKTQMKGKGRDLIVLIHGYSSDIDTALERAAELADKYKVKGKDGKTRAPVVMVFSWPSKGKMIPFASYISDRDYAAKSGRAIGRLFLRLCDFLLKEKQNLFTNALRSPFCCCAVELLFCCLACCCFLLILILLLFDHPSCRCHYYSAARFRDG